MVDIKITINYFRIAFLIEQKQTVFENSNQFLLRG